MITCNLMGGLGNQLFQIFTTISCAIQNNTSFYFPKNYSCASNDTKRHYYWDSFFRTLVPFTTTETKHTYFYREPGFNYTPIPAFLPMQNILLNGYFQTPLYFQSHWDTIVRMIRYKDMCKQVQEKYKNEYPIEGGNTISMHFRLGDYKKIQEYHPLLSKEYYQNALNHILQNSIPNSQTIVYYFCEEEDNDTVSHIIQELKRENIVFVKVADTIVDWEQMILMSLCRHHIIANSTFSWWGAYFSRVLDTSVDSITCYPNVWFGPALSHYYMEDLYPKEWIKIE